MKEKVMKLSDRPVVVKFSENSEKNQQTDTAIACLFADYFRRKMSENGSEDILIANRKED